MDPQKLEELIAEQTKLLRAIRRNTARTNRMVMATLTPEQSRAIDAEDKERVSKRANRREGGAEASSRKAR